MPATAGLPHAHAAPSRPRGPDRPAAGTIAEALRRAKHPSRSLSQLHRRTRYCGGRQNWRNSNSSELVHGNARLCAKNLLSIRNEADCAVRSNYRGVRRHAGRRGVRAPAAPSDGHRVPHRAPATRPRAHATPWRGPGSPAARTSAIALRRAEHPSRVLSQLHRCTSHCDVQSIQVAATSSASVSQVTTTCRASKS